MTADTGQQTDEAPNTGTEASALERIWQEIRDITRQVEQEARRNGRLASLHLDVRNLRRGRSEQFSRLGNLIYRAQLESERRPTLSRVEGYDDLIVQIQAMDVRIETVEAEIARLRTGGSPYEPPKAANAKAESAA